MGNGRRPPFNGMVRGRGGRGGHGGGNMNIRQGQQIIEDGNVFHVVEVLEDAGADTDERPSMELNNFRRDFCKFVERQDEVNRNLSLIPKMFEHHKKGLEAVATGVNQHVKAVEYLLKTVAHHNQLIPSIQRQVERVERRVGNMEVKLDQLTRKSPADRIVPPANNNGSRKRPRKEVMNEESASKERISCELCQKGMLRSSLWKHLNKPSCPALKARGSQETGPHETNDNAATSSDSNNEATEADSGVSH